ncbi:hypothetical protein COV61_04790 [Candidatus Micrarchaeota archaeon CG11_big_fil_rev_8_21_14_0_20_47_5]|nr:MAG: hypothetical protein AUJ17_03235 [Candidatus Micrarchaeota archaeon CG1_02_47_40]PIN82844.1 MAG: hypothetical protein COV61_04790 [Candidatus Micrarchaeota archaeon CG11_big_fil_rev_8_21_14_0_20_47_5]
MPDYLEKLNSLFSGEEIESKVEAKLKEYSNLITKETALFLLAKEQNLIREQTADSSTAESTKGRFSISGTVSKIFPEREYEGNGKKIKTQRLWLFDEKGEFTLVLWNEDTKLASGKIAIGGKIKVTGAYSRGGEVHLGYGGKAELLEGNESIPLGKLKEENALVNAEGSIDEILPDYFYKRKGSEAEEMMGSFSLTDGENTFTVCLWDKPEQVHDFKFKDKVRVERARFRNRTLNMNANSRIVLIEREKEGEIKGILEGIEVQGEGKEGAKARISGREYAISVQTACAILGISSLPDDVSLKTLVELKGKEIIGKDVSLFL